jgi:hypothetical protein
MAVTIWPLVLLLLLGSLAPSRQKGEEEEKEEDIHSSGQRLLYSSVTKPFLTSSTRFHMIKKAAQIDSRFSSGAQKFL